MIQTQLFSDLYLVYYKYLNTFLKLFFPCYIFITYQIIILGNLASN